MNNASIPSEIRWAEQAQGYTGGHIVADQTIAGGIITTLVAAIGWLAKRLYDAPRPADVDALRKDRDELRTAVITKVNEATSLAYERDVENRKLRDEITELRIVVARGVVVGGNLVVQRPGTRTVRRQRTDRDK
jgi:hypothetical protein